VAWYGSMRSSTTAIGSLPGRDGNRVRLYTRLVTTGPASIRGKLHRFRRSKGRYGLYRCEPGKAEAAKAYLTDQSRWAGWERRYSRKG
jgi:hypothetical protein